jgi:hypothetical protein
MRKCCCNGDPALSAPVGSGEILRSLLIEQTADETHSSSITFMNLIMTSVFEKTRESSRLYVLATFAASAASLATIGEFQIRVSGVDRRAAGITLSTTDIPQSGAVQTLVSGIAAGFPSVALRWRQSVMSADLQVRPVTAPNSEHSSLLVQEWA